jgi:Ca2+/Na+ antiporter
LLFTFNVREFHPLQQAWEILLSINARSLLSNLLLAVAVQAFGTWCSSVASNVLYATIGQAKVAITVFFGSYVSHEPLELTTVFHTLLITTSSAYASVSEAFTMKRSTKIVSFMIVVCCLILSYFTFHQTEYMRLVEKM